MYTHSNSNGSNTCNMRSSTSSNCSDEVLALLIAWLQQQQLQELLQGQFVAMNVFDVDVHVFDVKMQIMFTPEGHSDSSSSSNNNR